MFSSLFIVQSLQAELFLQYNGELLKVFKTLSVFFNCKSRIRPERVPAKVGSWADSRPNPGDYYVRYHA